MNILILGGGGHDHGLDHGGSRASCGCESQEADHPFAINCTDAATGATLAACNGGVPAASACEDAVATDPTCQIAFFILSAHHDHCPHDTLVRRHPRSHQRTRSRLPHAWRASRASLPACSPPRPPPRSRCATTGRAGAWDAPSRASTTRRWPRAPSSTARTRRRRRRTTPSSPRHARLVARAAWTPRPRKPST